MSGFTSETRPTDYLTPKHLETETGIKVGTLANMRSAKVGPRYVKVRNRVLYRRQDIDSWLSAGLVETIDSMGFTHETSMGAGR